MRDLANFCGREAGIYISNGAAREAEMLREKKRDTGFSIIP